MSRNFNSDQPGCGVLLISYALAGCFGAILGSAVRESIENADERVRRAQIDNVQIGQQLDGIPGVRSVGGLVLNDETRTLQFTAVDANGVPVVCTASYELGNDAGQAAQLAGDLACTQTVPAPR